MSRKSISRIILVPMLAALLIPLQPAAAQETGGANSAPVSFSLGTVRTQLEDIAIHYIIKYAKEFSGQDVFTAMNKGALFFTPEIHLEGGEADAFNGVIAKVTGSLLLFSTTTVAGVETPNTSFFHTLPFSMGIETSNRFENVNFLGEVGYVPWFQGSVPGILKTLRLGAFVQGGFKTKVYDASGGAVAAGGSADESEEAVDSGLLRLKGSGRINPTFTIGGNTGMGFGINAAGDVWYDIVNSEVYYSLEATFRILISEYKSLDFSYQKGSGAPNFNQGDQFSTKLTVVF